MEISSNFYLWEAHILLKTFNFKRVRGENMQIYAKQEGHCYGSGGNTKMLFKS